MAFDIEIIKNLYRKINDRVKDIRSVIGKPLTLSEKIKFYVLRVIFKKNLEDINIFKMAVQF